MPALSLSLIVVCRQAIRWTDPSSKDYPVSSNKTHKVKKKNGWPWPVLTFNNTERQREIQTSIVNLMTLL